MIGALGVSLWLRLNARIPEPAPSAACLPNSARNEPVHADTVVAAETVVASDGIPLMPAGSASAPPGPHHPHPITAQHERIFRENNLIQSLNGAVDVRDAAGIRRLLTQYRDEYPEGAHVLQAGYAIIADCIDHPGPAASAAARRYYDEELASNIRRYVRRNCLE